MTLEDAVTYYSEIAKECRLKARIESNDYMDMRDATYEAEQLADWLNELIVLRERIDDLISRRATMDDLISRRAAIEALGEEPLVWHDDDAEVAERNQWRRDVAAIKALLPVQPEWNNHTVACLLAELFGDTCACNYNDIDKWLPEKCELLDSCPHTVGVACWEQFLKHKAERRTDE